VDHLTFVERLVHDLAWPLVVLALAGIFRHSLQEVILRISRLKFRGADLTFARDELDDARRKLHTPKVRIPDLDSESTRRALPPGAPPKETIKPVETEVIGPPQVYDDSLPPRLTVEESWLRLELSLRDLESRVAKQTSRSFRGLLAHLADTGLLTPELRSVIEQLYSARNQLLRAHGHIPRGIVDDFVKAVDQAQLSLQNRPFP